MAWELSPEIISEPPWSYSVTSDGRIFFVNDETRTTTWLHPVKSVPIATGNQTLPDLPKGWERGVTPTGSPYYIDHNKQETTFIYPATKESILQTEAIRAPPKQLFRPDDFPKCLHSPAPSLSPTMDGRRASKKKSINNNLRSPAVKRSSQSPVAMQGWLYKQGSDGLMLWKKRWFVLSDFCLFYYKGPEEDKTLGSILLPSYKISPCTSDDRVYRKYAFKAEHHNMRTYYFASETLDTMHMWMNAMSLASILQRNSGATILHERGEPVSGNSPTPNEDEDSGFTSYHSRRQVGSPQHDGNSTLASSYTSECYRYRADDSTSDMSHHMVDGGYLGSADKYPNGYGSVSDYRHNLQPSLKQHAPPKPKRTPADCWGEDMETSVPVSVPSPTPRNRHSDWEVVLRKPPQRRTPDPYARTAVLSVGAMPVNNHDEHQRNSKSVQRPHSTELGDFDANHAHLVRESRSQLDNERYVLPNYTEATTRSQNDAHTQDKSSMYATTYVNNQGVQSSACQESNYQVFKQAHKGKKAAPNSEQNTSYDSYLTNAPSPRVLSSEGSNVGMHVNYGSGNHRHYHERDHDHYTLQPQSQPHHAVTGEEDNAQFGTLADVPRGSNPMFARSSSARLPSVSAGTLGPHYRSSREKERDRGRDPSGRWSKVPPQMQMLTPSQREASMKRLLEWKRRMLQSPLTKKPMQRNLRAPQIGSVEDECSNQVLSELAHQEANVSSKGEDAIQRSLRDKSVFKENKEPGMLAGIRREEQESASCPRPSYRPSLKYPLQSLQDPRRAADAANCYHSYSSDDEESVAGSFRDAKRSGRSWLPDAPSSEDSRGLHILREVTSGPHLTSLATDDAKAGLSFSAGDLLGKTHEELVLLLIQLRRDQTSIEMALKRCRMDLDTEQRLLHVDTNNREIHIARHKELLDQHEDLTRQHELTKPLVNLVDNMVKLGALYGAGGNGTASIPGYENVEFGDEFLEGQLLQPNLQYKTTAPQQGMIEFSRQLQEQRLLPSEKGTWEQPKSAHNNLQDKLENLCKLDQAMQEESTQLFGLQQDKDNLERAIEGLRERAGGCKDDPSQLDRIRRQLWMAEDELAKVTAQLSISSKKLEETAAENVRLENEIMGLRQKVQASLKHHQALGATPLPAETSRMKAQLETELKRITTVMEDLANQRAELCKAMEHVKDRNHELLSHVRPSPTGVAGSAPLPGKKLHRSTYMETDLDTMQTHDIVDVKCVADNNVGLHDNAVAPIPLYVNSGLLDDHSKESKVTGDDVDSSFEYLQSDTAELYELQDIADADDKMKRFYGILPKEKPAEIKTVRIVKRESERRNKGKDRRKVGYDENSLRKDDSDEAETEVYDDSDIVDASELDEFQRSMSLPRNYGRFYPAGLAHGFTARPTPPSSLYVNTVNKTTPKYYRTPSLSGSDSALSAHERLFGQASPTTLSIPTFKSEAAKRIVEETAKELAFFDREREVVKEEAGSLRRRHKRRHYTISSSQPVTLETDAGNAHKLIHSRSRDDLDMERCLRVANTPDVVKSTIKKSDMFDESTIDRELGLPQKIIIPERYVEEEEVQLTVAERLQRLQKAESIRKMLSEGTVYSDVPTDEVASVTLKKKFEAEKKQREHLLALNQMIAQEVMQKSKAVAERARRNLPKVVEAPKEDDSDQSPTRGLPVMQQRENFLS